MNLALSENLDNINIKSDNAYIDSDEDSCALWKHIIKIGSEMSAKDIFDGHAVRVKFDNPDQFLKIAETLTRLGIPSYKNEKTLYQSCHILHKQGEYGIIHFKSLFALDGRETTITEEDISRRNSIVRLLVDWNLCELVDEKQDMTESKFSRIKIIKFSEKNDWNLKSKYSIGVKH